MQPVVIGDVLWTPSPEVIERSRLHRFMVTHDIESLAELQARSVADPEWFWAAGLSEVGLEFDEPYERVLDDSRGAPWARWFPGGQLNVARSCLEKHVRDGGGARPAVYWEAESGETETMTYADLQAHTGRLASALARLGAGPGDRIGLFLPQIPQTVVALLACARLGAVVVPLFSGFGAEAIASRLNDAEAIILLCADGFRRRGSIVAMKEVADQALARVPSIRHLVMCRPLVREVPWKHGRDLVWEQLVEDEPADFATESVTTDAPLMLIYTSGTTGRPKGAVHGHAGFPFKAALDLAFGFDMGPDDTLLWVTDIGWMMGPWQIYGSLLLGGTMAIFEGAPDHPGPDRLWRLAESSAVSILGVSPTLVRSLMGHGSEPVRGHDLSRLRVLGSTGEPWNPDPFRWLFHEVGQDRAPIVNYSGGTEISGGIVCGNLLTPLRPCSFAGPLPGMAADVVDGEGHSVTGEVGELVIRRPWPGMTNGFWNDPQRYLDAYWSRFPDVWVHGDWAYIDPTDGLWYILGRSDDTIKIAGKRLGPAEVESVLVSHPAVAEAAAVGVPHELKGEVLMCFTILRPEVEGTPLLATELQDLVAAELGRPLRPEAIHFVADLPRTRNAKILRRVVRAAYSGTDAGDLSALENPAAADAIRALAAER